MKTKTKTPNKPIKVRTRIKGQAGPSVTESFFVTDGFFVTQ